MKKRRLAVIIAAVLILGLGAAVFANLPRPISAYNTAFNLETIEDGLYLGSCDNGLVKVQVEVKVKNKKIENVNILQHQNGMGGAAEKITEQAVKAQSVEVDAISGATMSSKTILKAIENALSKGQVNK